MNKIKLKNNTYDMPSSWKDVNLKTYLEIINIEEESDIKKLIKTISILANIDIKELYEVDFNDLQNIDISFIYKEETDIEKIIEINGVKYGTIKDMKKLSVGEYVDLDHYSRTGQDIHKVVAILMRPIIDSDGELYTIEKYNNETIQARADLFLEHMNVSQLLGLSNFFGNTVSGFVKSLSRSLQEK